MKERGSEGHEKKDDKLPEKRRAATSRGERTDTAAPWKKKRKRNLKAMKTPSLKGDKTEKRVYKENRSP